MQELTVLAAVEKLEEVQEFLGQALTEYQCDDMLRMQFEIAVEEIFVNVAYYAYPPDEGDTVTIRCERLTDPDRISVTFEDRGIPYDPLAHPDPDVTLGAEERKIGGLGIYMVKQSMDNVVYRNEGGHNILTIEKNLSESAADE